EVPQRRGEPIIVDTDEAPREGTTEEELEKLNPAFDKDGTVTAGNAPGVNDGACAFVLMSDEQAAKEEIAPLATILSHEEVAVEAKDVQQTARIVINKLLEKAGKVMTDIDLFEINEAFGVVSLVSLEIAQIDPEKVHLTGGAVALAHPMGASGGRIILTLI